MGVQPTRRCRGWGWGWGSGGVTLRGASLLTHRDEKPLHSDALSDLLPEGSTGKQLCSFTIKVQFYYSSWIILMSPTSVAMMKIKLPRCIVYTQLPTELPQLTCGFWFSVGGVWHEVIFSLIGCWCQLTEQHQEHQSLRTATPCWRRVRSSHMMLECRGKNLPVSAPQVW